MTTLILGLALWWAVHLVPAVATPFRQAMIGRLGNNTWRGLFSVLIVLAIVLMALGWRSTVPAPVYAPPAAAPFAGAMMIIALVLFFSSRVPTDIKRVLRHPQLPGMLVWSLAHLAVNGDQRSLVLFGGLGLWAVVEIVAINRRDGVWIKPAPVGLVRSAVPLVIGALAWALFAWLHPWIAGVPVLPPIR